MSQGTFSNTLIQLEAFKRIFVFRPNIDFFSSRHFSLVYVPKDLGVSKTSLGNNS